MAKNIQAHLKNETVAELEPPPGLRVAPATTVRETAELMQRHRTGCALVCEGDRLVGIFTEQDFLRRVVAKEKSQAIPVQEFMSRNPATIRPTDSIASVIARFHAGRYRRLPVVGDQGELVGCLTVRSLVHHLAEHFPAAVFNVAPVSKPMQNDREGA